MELLDIYPAKEEEEYYLIDGVMRLPPLFRDAIYLFYYERYSTAEIAGIMQTKESTVRSYLHRGRRKLKRWLEDEPV